MPRPLTLALRAATPADVPTVLAFIRGLAEYERLAHEAVATEADVHEALFGARPAAEVVLAEDDGQPGGRQAVGFALFFHGFSTFAGRRTLFLEDLFVVPEARGRGVGTALLVHLARLAGERGCARFEWNVLDWNADAIAVYRALGAVPMDGWTTQRLSGDALTALAARDLPGVG